jgi:hypothetical protein
VWTQTAHTAIAVEQSTVLVIASVRDLVSCCTSLCEAPPRLTGPKTPVREEVFDAFLDYHIYMVAKLLRATADFEKHSVE